MNKRLTILLVLLFIAISIFISDRYGDKFLPIKLDADKIEEITISTDRRDQDSKNDIILSKENNDDEIAEITRLFNESVMYENQKMGTIHPHHVRITYKNGKDISFGCGFGAIFTVNKGKGQYNYVNGELDEYISDTVSSWEEENFFIEDVNLTIVNNDTFIQPYRNFLSCTTYYEGGWLFADGMGAIFFLPEKAEELPIITYDSSLEFIISSEAKMMGVSVFNDDFERTHHRIDEAEFFELCKNLDVGTYYVSVAVSYKGKHIAKEDKYESFADEYIFRMDVEEEALTEEKDEELYVTVAPPQFDSEEEFLEEIRLIKNDKEKEKSIVEGKLLAEMQSYYMPAVEPDGYKLLKITITSEVFHLLYLKDGQEYSEANVFELGYFYRNSDLTLEKVIRNTHHVQSQYSDRLYFYLNESYGEYRLAHYELDGIVFYLQLHYGVNLDDKKQIAEIENLCRMVKKNIAD